jgi:predicted SnoaL-like aldol condensation-catalyzing enzyme
MRLVVRSAALVMATAVTIMTAVHVQAAETKAEADLKRMAIEFYNAALNEKDFAKASKYLASRYIQHSPTAPDGAQGLETMVGMLKKNMPEFHGDITQSFVDGKTVILHVHVTRKAGDPGLNDVDFIRFDDNNKVAEHWDVADELPAKIENPNQPY